MDDEQRKYSSKIISVYLHFLATSYPEIDTADILEHSGITQHQIDDQSSWFTQKEVDRFHDYVVLKTGNPNIAREAGRFSVSSEALGVAKQYALGFRSLSSLYLLMEKLYPIMSRAATIKARKVGKNKVEIVSKPSDGVKERPNQCQNRIGTLESLPHLFGGELARVDHPECYHKGSDCCRYIVSWTRDPLLILGKIKQYSILSMIVCLVAMYIIFPSDILPVSILSTVSAFLLFLLIIENRISRRFSQTVVVQGDTAENLMDEMNRRYNDAMLIRRIGQASSTILNETLLVQTVIDAIDEHLEYDRGVIMLENAHSKRLVFAGGFGYDSRQANLLESAEFSLTNPASQGPFVKAFRDQDPILVNDTEDISEFVSDRSRDLIRALGTKSLICVPITYERKSIGIVVVDNVISKRPFTQSDTNLLVGVAAQIASSIINARSYQELQRNELKYRELVENANSIIMRIDTDGNVLFFNEFAQRFFGYSPNDILYKNVVGTIFPTDATTAESFVELADMLSQDPGHQAARQNRNILRNGRMVWIAWTYRPVYDASGGFNEILCIGTDITDLRQASDEKELLERQLQQSQKMEAIGNLAGGIAHDFNNILAAIIGYSELALLEEGDLSKLKSKVESVLKAGLRAKDLVHQILTFTRQTDDEKRPVKLHLIVAEVIDLLRATLPFSIVITHAIQNKNDIILANSTQIHQVLMNLCTNADHAMSEGGGNIHISLETVLNPESVAQGEYLRLSVEDTGKGMTEEVVERIFEPYYTTKEKGVGTGLGLSVVHGIVQKHKGYITVDSVVGKGTKIVVYWPVIKDYIEDTASGNASMTSGKGRILFVDDESDLVEVGVEMLNMLGYRANGISDPIQALDEFSRSPYSYDLVITDMSMPHLTGDLLAKGILNIRQDIPIIMCTGFNSRMSESYMKKIGICQLILKPFVFQDLADAVDRVLS